MNRQWYHREAQRRQRDMRWGRDELKHIGINFPLFLWNNGFAGGGGALNRN